MNGNDLRDQLFQALRGDIAPDDPCAKEFDQLALADLERIMPVIDRYIAWRQQIWEQSLIYALEARQETEARVTLRPCKNVV